MLVLTNELQLLWYIGPTPRTCKNCDYSAQAGRQKMPEHIGGLSLEGGNTSPKTSSAVLLTISWVPVQRWDKLGWNVSRNLTTEDMAKET